MSDDENPAIACTETQLAFAAWQRARGLDSLAQTGESWDAFSSWIDSFVANRPAEINSRRRFARAAWLAAVDAPDIIPAETDFTFWWSTIVNAQPTVS